MVSSALGTYHAVVTGRDGASNVSSYSFIFYIRNQVTQNGIGLTRDLFVKGRKASGSNSVESAETSSETVDAVGDVIELVYSQPVVADFMVVVARSHTGAGNYSINIASGDGTTYTDCGSMSFTNGGAVVSSQQFCPIPIDLSSGATHWRATITAISGSLTSIVASTHGTISSPD
jgi:hypothetical protein